MEQDQDRDGRKKTKDRTKLSNLSRCQTRGCTPTHVPSANWTICVSFAKGKGLESVVDCEPVATVQDLNSQKLNPEAQQLSVCPSLYLRFLFVIAFSSLMLFLIPNTLFRTWTLEELEKLLKCYFPSESRGSL